MNMLHLEDAVDENPQALSLLRLHEEDSQLLKKYSSGLHFATKRVFQASEEMSNSLRLLTQHLHGFQKMSFNINPGNELGDMLVKIAKHLEEVSSIYRVLSTQIGDNVCHPLSRFSQNDLEEISAFTEMVAKTRSEYDLVLSKYLKLQKRKSISSEELEYQAELVSCQHRLEQASLQHYSNLNILQHSRSSALLEPLAGLMSCHRTHFKAGKDTTDQAVDIANDADNLVAISLSNKNEYAQYAAQKTAALEQSAQKMRQAQDDIPPETNLSTKIGYVYQRFKQSILASAKWEKGYLSIANNNLMWQGANDIGCCSLLELQEDIKVMPSDHDDRRFVFSVQSKNKTLSFQAFGEKELQEWVSAINNACKNLAPLSVTTLKREESIEFNLEPGCIKFDFEDFQEIISEERKNPFTEKPSNDEEFSVRFLGSIQVQTDKGSSVVLQAMQHVMAARAMKNVFKMIEIQLYVDVEAIYLVEDKSIKFPFSYVTFWFIHPDNCRIFGIILKNHENIQAYIFESNNPAQDIIEKIEVNAKAAFEKQLQLKAEERMKETNILLENIAQLSDKTPSSEEDKSFGK